MKTKNTPIKGLVAEKKSSIVKSVRMTEEEFAHISESANKYAGGNICAWLRYTALNYKPKSKELANV